MAGGAPRCRGAGCGARARRKRLAELDLARALLPPPSRTDALKLATAVAAAREPARAELLPPVAVEAAARKLLHAQQLSRGLLVLLEDAGGRWHEEAERDYQRRASRDRDHQRRGGGGGGGGGKDAEGTTLDLAAFTRLVQDIIRAQELEAAEGLATGAKLDAAFAQFDADRNGRIDAGELGQALEMMDIGAARHHEHDATTRHGGTLDRPTFGRLIVQIVASQQSEAALKELKPERYQAVFNKFDVDSSGSIDASELEKILDAFGVTRDACAARTIRAYSRGADVLMAAVDEWGGVRASVAEALRRRGARDVAALAAMSDEGLRETTALPVAAAASLRALAAEEWRARGAATAEGTRLGRAMVDAIAARNAAGALELLDCGADPSVDGAHCGGATIEWRPLEPQRAHGGDVHGGLGVAHGGDVGLRGVGVGRGEPLRAAAACGLLDVIDALIAAGADVGAADRWGHTALTDAVGAGEEAAVELLLRRGADPTVRSHHGRTLLQLSEQRRLGAERGGPGVAAAAGHAASAYEYAMEPPGNRYVRIDELITLASVAAADALTDDNPLAAAAAAGGGGAGGAAIRDTGDRNEMGEALVKALDGGDEARALWLLDEGAPAAFDDGTGGGAPLRAAAARGLTAAMAALLHAGARRNPAAGVVPESGNDVMSRVRRGSLGESSFESMSEGSAPLSKKKREEPFVDAPTAGAQRRTPLMAAAFYGELGAVELLLRWGARDELKDNDGETALVYAQRGAAPPPVGGVGVGGAARRRAELIALLSDAGAIRRLRASGPREFSPCVVSCCAHDLDTHRAAALGKSHAEGGASGMRGALEAPELLGIAPTVLLPPPPDAAAAARRDAMVHGAATVIALLSPGYFRSERCCDELRLAMKAQKKVVLAYDATRHATKEEALDAALEWVPPPLREQLLANEAVPLYADRGQARAAAAHLLAAHLAPFRGAVPPPLHGAFTLPEDDMQRRGATGYSAAASEHQDPTLWPVGHPARMQSARERRPSVWRRIMIAAGGR